MCGNTVIVIITVIITLPWFRRCFESGLHLTDEEIFSLAILMFDAPGLNVGVTFFQKFWARNDGPRVESVIVELLVEALVLLFELLRVPFAYYNSYTKLMYCFYTNPTLASPQLA